MARLSVNVNKVATLRNTRPIGIPSVVHAAELCLAAGAAGITVHPRPDERHIRPADVDALADLLRLHPHAEYNIEGNPLEGVWLDHVRRAKPTQCTLVPDAREQSTSDHGWDLSEAATRRRLAPLVSELRALGCRVSLFMDATSDQWQAARDLGADRVELYTEPYATGFARGDQHAAAPFAAAALAAAEVGLGINAGHDLNLANLGPFIDQVPGVLEVSIGHALIADALEWGLPEVVRRYTRAARGKNR